MMLLAIDTSTAHMNLALYNSYDLISEQSWRTIKHGELLAPSTEKMLDVCGVSFNELDIVAVTSGPGTYRYLRVGIAFAKGIALGANIPLIGVNTLDVIAAGQTFTNSRHRLLCVLQSTRQRIIAGEYRVKKGRWEPRHDPHLTTWDDLLTDLAPSLYYVAGEIDPYGIERIDEIDATDNDITMQLVSPARRQRRAGFLAEVAWQRYHAEDAEQFVPDALQPVYITK